jgi:hypothetical protein
VLFLFLGGLDFTRSGAESLLLWEPSLSVIVETRNPEFLYCDAAVET